MTPTASVVVTTYATPPDLLAIGIDSLLGQTLTDIEVVLVVDGDLTPGAEEVVTARADADPRLVVLRPGRVGRARALNLGVRAASAPLVGIQDADDASHPRRLEVQVARLDAGSGAGAPRHRLPGQHEPHGDRGLGAARSGGSRRHCG